MEGNAILIYVHCDKLLDLVVLVMNVDLTQNLRMIQWNVFLIHVMIYQFKWEMEHVKNVKIFHDHKAVEETVLQIFVIVYNN